jgi:hypothetical protein
MAPKVQVTRVVMTEQTLEMTEILATMATQEILAMMEAMMDQMAAVWVETAEAAMEAAVLRQLILEPLLLQVQSIL